MFQDGVVGDSAVRVKTDHEPYCSSKSVVGISFYGSAHGFAILFGRIEFQFPAVWCFHFPDIGAGIIVKFAGDNLADGVSLFGLFGCFNGSCGQGIDITYGSRSNQGDSEQHYHHIHEV